MKKERRKKPKENQIGFNMYNFYAYFFRCHPFRGAQPLVFVRRRRRRRRCTIRSTNYNQSGCACVCMREFKYYSKMSVGIVWCFLWFCFYAKATLTRKKTQKMEIICEFCSQEAAMDIVSRNAYSTNACVCAYVRGRHRIEKWNFQLNYDICRFPSKIVRMVGRMIRRLHCSRNSTPKSCIDLLPSCVNSLARRHRTAHHANNNNNNNDL